MNIKSHFCLILFLLSHSTLFIAQNNEDEKVQEIETVVITGQYKKTSSEKSINKIKVIDRETIEAIGAVNLKDILANQINIRISQDNVLGSSMSLQGVSGQNIKILIDGVPVIGRLNGNIDVSQINLNDIQQIEIVEGPLSVNYGTDALAGTINLISKKPKNKGLSTYLNTYYESVGQYNIDANIAYKFNKKISTSTSFGRNFFDGWNAYDPFIEFPESRLADSLRFKQWKPKEQYFAKTQIIYSQDQLNIKPYFQFFNEKITNRGYPRQPYNETAFDDYYNTWRYNLGVDISKQFKNKSNLRILCAYNNFKRIKNTYIKDLTTLNNTLSNTPGSQDTTLFNLLMSRGSWNTSNKNKFNYQLGYDINIESTYGKRIEGGSQEQTDLALFGSFEWNPFSKFIIKPALRYAYNSNYKAPLIPSFNAKFNNNNFTYRASYARGFRAPSLKELHFEFIDINHNIVGNQNLISEQSNNYNFNITYKKRKSKLKIDVSGFYNDIENLITLAISPNEPQQYTYVNIGEFKTIGSQINSSLKLGEFIFDLGTSYTGRSNNIENDTIPLFTFSPEFKANVIYNNRDYNFRISLFYKYNGKRPGFYASEDDIIQTMFDAYDMLDINISKNFLNNKIEWTVGAKNILNIQDVNATNTSDGVHSSGSNRVSMNWGRSFFTSIKFRINEK